MVNLRHLYHAWWFELQLSVVISVFAFPLFLSERSGRDTNHSMVLLQSSAFGALIFAFAGKSLALVLLGAELFFIPQPIIFLVVLMTITDSCRNMVN